MNIGHVLKRGWQIAWRYKILWLFGLLAAEGGAGGGSGFNSRGFGNGSTGRTFDPASAGRAAGAFLEQWGAVLIGVVVFIVVVSIIVLIFRVAALGGMVRLTDDADADREVRAANGWSTGFQHWGRVFLQLVAFAIPVIVIMIAFVLVAVAVFGGSIVAILAGTRSVGAVAGGIIGLVAGTCGLILVGAIVFFAIAVLYLILRPLSLRYAILFDRPAIKAIGDAWRLVRAKPSRVLLAAFVLWAVGLGFGIALLIVLAPFGLGVVFAFLARSWAFAALGIAVVVAIAVAASSVFSAFYSAAWTVAFRQLTDLSPVPAQAMAAPAPASYYTPTPPPPAPGPAAPAVPPAPDPPQPPA
jgi:hypothetical protein